MEFFWSSLFRVRKSLPWIFLSSYYFLSWLVWLLWTESICFKWRVVQGIYPIINFINPIREHKFSSQHNNYWSGTKNGFKILPWTFHLFKFYLAYPFKHPNEYFSNWSVFLYLCLFGMLHFLAPFLLSFVTCETSQFLIL